MGLLYPVIPK